MDTEYLIAKSTDKQFFHFKIMEGYKVHCESLNPQQPFMVIPTTFILYH